MKRLFTTACTFVAIAAIAFIFANIFIDAWIAEDEIRSEHARIHWRSKQ